MNDALLNVLRSVDTPTVCNAIEAAQGTRGFNNFTKATMVASAPKEKSVVGYALTAKIAATSAPEEAAERGEKRQLNHRKEKKGKEVRNQSHRNLELMPLLWT